MASSSPHFSRGAVLFTVTAFAGATWGCSSVPQAAPPRDVGRSRDLGPAQAVETPPASGGTVAVGVGDLLQLLARLDGPGMERACESLLLAGEPGFKVLHDFFHQCDVEHEKILTLTHDPVLVFGLLRLVARYPDQIAALSIYLMSSTRDRPKSFIRREIYNFLPVFLNQHAGRYPEVRKKLEEDIVYQLEQGGDYLYKIDLALGDLGFAPAVASFLPCLRDPARAADHDQALAILARRGDEGLAVILGFIDEAPPDLRRSVAAAVRHVIEAEKDRPASERVAKLLAHSDESIRRDAILNYFRFPRPVAEAQRALEFLSGDGEVKDKQLLVRALLPANGEIILALDRDAGRIADEKLREMVAKYAESVRKRQAGGAKAGAKAGSRSGG